MLLQKSSSPDVVFIASRILFLATASSATAGSFIVSIVERKPSGRAHSLVDILGLRLESLTTALLSGTKMAREAIVDLLKFVFNILTHYPKVHFLLSSFSLPLISLSSSIARGLWRLAVVMTMPKSWESTGPIDLMGSHNESLSRSSLTPLSSAFFLRFSVLSIPSNLAHPRLSRRLSITSFMPSSSFPSSKTYKQYGSHQTLVRAVVPHTLVPPPPSLHPAAPLPQTHHASRLATTAPSTSPSLCSPQAGDPSRALPPPRGRRPHQLTILSCTRSASSKSRSRITSRAPSKRTTPRCARPPRPRARVRWTSCSLRS